MSTTIHDPDDPQLKFTIDELDVEARKHAIESMRYVNVIYQDWHEFIRVEWVAKLQGLGFIEPDIRYSGFSSQGDGASFTCGYIDRKFEMTAPVVALTVAKRLRGGGDELPRLEFRVERIEGHHYLHEKTVHIAGDYYSEGTCETEEERDVIRTWYEEVRYSLTEEVRSLCREIYKELERECEFQTSDEQALETIKANEYRFDSGGDII